MKLHPRWKGDVSPGYGDTVDFIGTHGTPETGITRFPGVGTIIAVTDRRTALIETHGRSVFCVDRKDIMG